MIRSSDDEEGVEVGARVLAVLVAVVACFLLAACGGSGGSSPASTETTTTETTTTEAAAAEVTTFDLGDLKCGAATTAPVSVTWETANATAVEIAVDSFSPAGFGPSGTTNVVVPCDDESHTITITPESDAGTGEPQSKDVSPS
jgi:hypothetical protein